MTGASSSSQIRHTTPTVREAVIELLRVFGMTCIFGNPGSTEMPLYRNFPDDFRYVLGLQESVAVAMADGYAQASRNAAVVNLHSAAGVGHAMGAVFTAYKNRTPLIIIAGQQARSMLPCEPYLFSDQAVELPKPYVKWSREPARAQDVPAAVARAFYVAMTPPRGPALVSVPVDDWDRPAEPVAPRVTSMALRADPAQLEQVGKALGRAARPAFVVGAAVDQDLAFDEVVALAETQQARVWAAPMPSRCSFPESHPLFAGFLPPIREKLVERLDGHDLILVLGAPVFTYHIEGSGPYLPEGAELFQLIDDPQMAAWTPVGTSVLTSVREGVRDLLRITPEAHRTPPPARALPDRVTGADGITQAFLVQTIADLRPADSVIVEEAPSTRPVMCERLPIDRPESFYTCASGGLGHSLPAAVGIALARPTRPVIAVIGDGSSMYSIQALWSAARLGPLPMTIIIVNNGSYATVDNFARHFDIGKPVGTDLSGIDFVGLARAQGVPASRVRRPGELVTVLRAALAAPGPRLVEVTMV
jgi:benzoylformate decarboxylase